MIKAVGINDSVRLRAFNNAKNGHAHNNINNNIERNRVLNVEDKPLLLSAYHQPQKAVSFKAKVYETVPEDWVYQKGWKIDGIVTTNGVNERYGYSCDMPMLETFPSAETIILDEKNIGKMFSFFDTKIVQDPLTKKLYKQPVNKGYLYINGGGKSTLVGRDEIDSYIYSKDPQALAECLVSAFNKDGYIDERNEFLEKNVFKSPQNVEIHINYLVEEGRAEEAIELYPDKAEEIIKKEKEILKLNYSTRLESEQLDAFEQALIDCDIEEILAVEEEPKWFDDKKPVKYKYADRLPKSVLETNADQRNDLLKLFLNNSTFEEYSALQKKEAKKDSMLQALVTDCELDRIPLAIFTLGISEISYHNQLWLDAEKNHEKMESGILMASDLLHMITEAKQKYNEEQRKVSYEGIEIERQKEAIKDRLDKVLLLLIKGYAEDERVFVPNCVMLTGKNTSINKDILLSLEKMTAANFLQVNSQKSNDKMQEDLFDALELAEEDYQETGKRMIIFVNGMEKLLNPKYNSKPNIACMKDLMSSASEDYHSTIVFSAKDPKKLDPGALATHRVEYKIETPFEFIGGGKIENQ